eukprot:TRINITY_DN8734_c0_g3_i1.p1 TRINITY_DN8734_c0_g3~~TRINITY_DN8734_c0_g3_i1.p1  ORF type:complete len:202 (-),score=32.79 TRINITY_DN8734_c0_g3_i1:946-1551(-)
MALNNYSVLERGRVNPTRSRPPSSSVNPNPNPFLVISGNQNSGLSFRSVPSQNLKSEPLSSPATRVLSFAATICYRKLREDLLPSIFSLDLQQSLSLFFSETEPSRCGPLSLSLRFRFGFNIAKSKALSSDFQICKMLKRGSLPNWVARFPDSPLSKSGNGPPVGCGRLLKANVVMMLVRFLVVVGADFWCQCWSRLLVVF